MLFFYMQQGQAEIFNPDRILKVAWHMDFLFHYIHFVFYFCRNFHIVICDIGFPLNLQAWSRMWFLLNDRALNGQVVVVS